MFHEFEAHLRSLTDVLGVPEYFQACGICFLDGDAELVVRDRIVDLEIIDTGRHEAPEICPRLVGGTDNSAFRVHRPEWSVHFRARHKHSRTLDLSIPQHLTLREDPGGVIVQICNSRHAIWQEHRQLVFLEMNVAVNQAWKNGAAG